MLQPNYTEKESKLFTGRTSYLKQIGESISKKNIAAVLSHSGYGRTTLLKHYAAKNNAAYIDLKKASLSPENFAVEFISSICSKTPQTVDNLKQLKLGKRCKEIISTVDNELQKIKPDQGLILKSAFMFAEEFALEQGKKTTIILEHFDELLKLNNFSQIKSILDIFFDSIARNKSCSFIISSSSVHLMKRRLKKYTSDIIEVQPLSMVETKELFEKMAGKTDERIIKELHKLSAGTPLVVKSIATRFKDEKTADTQKNIALLKYILISDLTTTTSQSYFYCSKLFTDSLNRARGEALLKTILKAVSKNQALRLTEIARLVYRSGPVTKSLLERLIEVDIITKTDNTFDFTNPVLKQWCSLMFSNIEFNDIPDEKVLSGVGGLL
jgi:hypothetical protein